MKSQKFNKTAHEIVEDSLNWIGEYHPNLRGIAGTILPREDASISTMGVRPSGVGETLLLFNPEFVVRSSEMFHNHLPSSSLKTYGKSYICNVCKHEVYHILLEHWAEMLKEEYNPTLWNIAADTVINAQVEWGEGQFSLSAAYDPDVLKEAEYPGFASLSHMPFWTALCLGQDHESFTSAISPSSVWFSVQRTAAYAVAELANTEVVKRRKKYKSAGLNRMSCYEFVVYCDGKKKLFGIDGFSTNAKQLLPGNPDEIEAAQLIWADILVWLNLNVIRDGIGKNSSSAKWYALYKRLYELLDEFKKALGVEVQILFPAAPGTYGGLPADLEDSDLDSDGQSSIEGENAVDEEGRMVGPGSNTSDCVRELVDEVRTEHESKRGKKGWSDTEEQFESELFKTASVLDTAKWAVLFDKAVGRSRKYSKTKTFYRPHRRWGTVWPGQKKKWEGCVNLAIDTSGSVSADVLKRFFDHLTVQARKHKELEYNLVLYNSVLYDTILDWKPADGPPNIQISGTVFTVALDELERLFRINRGLCVMFTDGYCSMPEKRNYDSNFAKWLAWVIWPDGNPEGKWGSQGVMEM